MMMSCARADVISLCVTDTVLICLEVIVKNDKMSGIYVIPCHSWGAILSKKYQFGNTSGNKQILVTFATKKVVLCRSWGIHWGISLFTQTFLLLSFEWNLIS
jgi:hypothetical protein